MEPDEYTKLLLRVVNVLRQDGLLLGLKLGLELNRLLIAKLHDESLVDTGQNRVLSATSGLTLRSATAFANSIWRP